MVLDRQVSMLGHVMRREPSHLLRKVTLDEQLQRPQSYKRVGRPRLNWVEETVRRAHMHIGKVDHGQYVDLPQDIPFDAHNQEHVDNLWMAAADRKF